jgi:ATP-dependent helicase/nuclease subunit A
MTIVAGFGDTPMFRRDNNPMHAERNANGDIQWILNLPNKDVLEQEPRLLAARAAEEEKAAYEALCLLYVAMTRPRYGLYCLALPPQRNSSMATWHQLFEHAFGCADEPRRIGCVEWWREWGDPGWIDQLPRETPAPAPRARLAALSGPLPPIRPILRRAAAPSVEAHAGERPQRRLASPEGRRFGTLVHDFLATIEWIEFDDPGSPTGVPAVLAAAPERLRGRLEELLAGPLARAVFGRPDGGCLLWREKPYLLRKRDTIAGGIIDRAVLRLDSAGKPLHAVIFDFKTDALDPARPAAEQLLEKYRLQLERYREALAILAGMPPERVEAVLVPV